MRKIFLLLIISASMLYASDDQSSNTFQQNILRTLGGSQTIEQLNDEIAIIRSSNKQYRDIVDQNGIAIISSYLQHRFPGEFSSSYDFFAEALNKGPLYYQYLEPLIFITKHLKLGALNNLLIASGVDTNINMQRLSDDYNIADIVSEIYLSNDEEVKEALVRRLVFLLKIGLVNFQDERSESTALINASEAGLQNIVQLLLSYGANINAKKSYGRTALMDASMHGHENIVKLLIDSGADVNAKNENGRTALIYGVNSQNKNIIESLIKAGADVNAKTNQGDTALTEALRIERHFGDSAIKELLMQAGAK